MKLSKAFIPTLKENPSDAVVKSHQFMLRSGMIRLLAAGIYSHLPFGWRILKKIQIIIREEMDAIGGQEFHLPAINPIETWNETGRADDFGAEMFKFKDRKSRDMCLAPTHEEVICSIARGEIRSYKNLPQIWYQIQNKFRDEPRPRSGVLRTRQFLMKDSYSLDADKDGLDISYNKHSQAYKSIFARCGLDFFIVSASSGLMGGSGSQEFMVESEAGEDTVALCDNCGYASNAEIAEFKITPFTNGNYTKLEEIYTPTQKTIDEVSEFLTLPKQSFIKSLVYLIDSKPVMILIRGDYDLNESKMLSTFGNKYRPAENDEILNICGANAGFIGPIGIKDIEIYVDKSLLEQKGFVSGANKDQYHIAGIDPQVDIKIKQIVDVALVNDGDICANCGKVLRIVRAIELGHIFKLGTKYSESMNATFLDRNGKENPIIMGSYGIGIERIVAAFIEQNLDENGICWDSEISPYQVHIIPINYKNEKIGEASNTLYEDLLEINIDCLLDDRDFSPGFKFRDADLLGIPIHIIIGEKNLQNNMVEFKFRKNNKKEIFPFGSIIPEIKKALSCQN
ncbi:proline--tRNA ligase [candidate division KSB1 bacterium]|nr:proline--tRNA ligase [candidate division KSB1 bacterium]